MSSFPPVVVQHLKSEPMSEVITRSMAAVVREYLCTLSKFYKWQQPKRNLVPGDIVVIEDNIMGQTRWPLVRIIEVFPGNDGQVRVALVKTAKGTYRRPAVKMVLLLEHHNL